VPLFDPMISGWPACLCDIEVACAIHRRGRRLDDLPGGRASSGDYGPVSLDVPLLDAVAAHICGIEVAGRIHCEAADIATDLAHACTCGGNHGPVPLGIALLDPGIDIA